MVRPTTSSPATLKDRLSQTVVVGAFASISPAAVEILAWRGYEMVCIDGEHASLGPSEIETMIRAADACGIPCLVRVAVATPAISHALDAGAAGVLVPRIETEAQARECAELVRYPPSGTRGLGPGRASKYGQDLARLAREANDAVLLAVQIETVPGVHAATAIASVDGVDLVFVGPGDLASSLGCEAGSPEHVQAIETVLDAARGAGKLTGIFCRTPEQMAPWLTHGVRLFLLGGDAGLLGAAAAEAVGGARDLLAERTIDGP